MSAAIGHKTKKRKQAATEVSGEPSTKRSKTVNEKAKHSHKASKRKDEKKQPADGQFKVITATLAISIPPMFASKPREGAEEMLDSLVMRYAFLSLVCKVLCDE
jgi:DNA-directed RNA polymerase I subunit RPA43